MHEMQFVTIIIIVLVLYDVIKKHYNNYFIDYIKFRDCVRLSFNDCPDQHHKWLSTPTYAL